MLFRKRVFVAAGALLIFSANVLFAQNGVEMAKGSLDTQQINEMLLKEVKLQYQAVDFATVIKDLEKKLSVNIVLDQSARDDSLTEDDEVNFRIEHPVPLGRALSLLLGEYNATIAIEDGLVRIVSRDVARDPQFFTKTVFDVRPLIEELTRQRLKRLANAPEKPIEWEERNSIEQEFLGLVRSSIVPEDWIETSGDGTIRMFGGVCVVVQSYEVTCEIRKLIQELSNALAFNENN